MSTQKGLRSYEYAKKGCAPTSTQKLLRPTSTQKGCAPTSTQKRVALLRVRKKGLRPTSTQKGLRSYEYTKKGCALRADWNRGKHFADAVGVLRLWNLQETGNVRRRPGAGWPRATTSTDDRYIQLTARRNRTENATQLQRQLLLATGRRVSSQTVRNRLHEGGIYARRPMVCIPLTPCPRAARRRWAAEHRDWEQHDLVLFTDESLFSLECDTRRVLVWRDRGMIMPDRIRLVENMLEAETIQRMEFPACSDLNPIEHVYAPTTHLRDQGRLLLSETFT
ncbi:transposable element Tcb2 transposase [Trichonephila clavipes]|nr:transposable element Tcb2 transposase [Trichonephila clavipes]